MTIALPAVQDEILDAQTHLRRLENALESHQLDRQAFLDALGEAARHCQQQAQTYANIVGEAARRGSLFTVATACYVARAHELTRNDRAHGGFSAWCRQHGFSRMTGWRLAKIGESADPAASLQAFRDKTRETTYASIERAGRPRPYRIDIDDPLSRIKLAWFRLSPEQQENFRRWLADEDRPRR